MLTAFFQNFFKICTQSDHDFKVVSSDNKEFKLHKEILSTNEYFKTLIWMNMKERQSNTIHLPENAEILNAIFCFIYTGEIEDVKENEWLNLLAAANKYMLKGLEDGVATKIKTLLTVENAIYILIFTTNTELHDFTLTFITK
jgi:hypothetical protein